jgi:hypothetical protein
MKKPYAVRDSVKMRHVIKLASINILITPWNLKKAQPISRNRMHAKSLGASSHAPNLTTMEFAYASSGSLPIAMNRNISIAFVMSE